MEKEKLQQILYNHKLWLYNKGGERANLQCVDLQDANLRGADLQDANLRYADLRDANLRYANLQSADLQGADLRYADLQGANLRGADLRDANLDYSCFPLRCGGSKFKADEKLVYQLLAHICTLDVDGEDFKKIREFVLPYAKKSHRAKDLGLI
jgi:hypothetical protein